MSIPPDSGHPLPPYLEQLLSPEFILTRTIQCYTFLIGLVRAWGEKAFEPYPGPAKPLSAIDFWVEQYFSTIVAGHFADTTDRPDVVHVIRTEDVVASLNLDHRSRYCMLIDVLDGAHLYQKRLGNWCSALTVFDRITNAIYAAYIVHPSAEKIYYATYEQPHAYMMHVPGLSQMETFPFRMNHQEDYIEKTRKEGGWNRHFLRIPTGSKALMNATVCLNAQRCSTLFDLLDSSRFPAVIPWLTGMAFTDRDLRANGAELGFRLYNMGGNPMLARLCDGGADVVLDLGGSLANDWVPGAYIALKAGAYVGSLKGQPITEPDLSLALGGVGHLKSTYIAAASEGLYRETLQLLSFA